MSPPLSKWRPRRTVIDLYNEKDNTLWYWRIIATLSACWIMIGFIVFPFSFKPTASLTISSKASTITALVLLGLGYVLSTVTALLCNSWLFRLDILYVPCFTSCLLGFVNVLYHSYVHSGTPQWTSPAVAAMLTSSTSALAYALAATWTFRKIYIVRSRDVMHRHHSISSTDKMMPETELQRQQLLRLLQQQQDARNGSPEINSSTFKLEWEWPGDGERRNTRSTLGTLRHIPRAARDLYESRTNSMYGYQDPANSSPARMNPVAEEVPPNPGLAPLPSTAYSPRNNDHDDVQTPGIINARSYTQDSSPPPPQSHPPQLQENGYPLEKPPIPDLNERHPLERRQNHYHMIEEDQPAIEFRMRQHGEQLRSASRASTQSREDRRMEIELSEMGRGRGVGLKRDDLDDIDFVPSIKRVETDGFGRNIAN
ncbi:hypothetical protein N7G274_008266 [Stereocaulon virgatum]|uniref:MARVEL domain-containing protein n=1 Tax=Stereocaulon virgatum TaxID=373712 RepID=A0ABR4A1S5_9LECA